MRINDDLYKNARAYCDKNSIRFKDFLEDAIENAMFENDVPVKKSIDEKQTDYSYEKNQSVKEWVLLKARNKFQKPYYKIEKVNHFIKKPPANPAIFVFGYYNSLKEAHNAMKEDIKMCPPTFLVKKSNFPECCITCQRSLVLKGDIDNAVQPFFAFLRCSIGCFNNLNILVQSLESCKQYSKSDFLR